MGVRVGLIIMRKEWFTKEGGMGCNMGVRVGLIIMREGVVY